MMNEALDRWDKKLNEKMDDISDVMNHSISIAWSMELGSHVSPRRQTGSKQTLGLASARRAPQQQHRQCVGIAFLHAGLNPAQLPTRPVSA